MGFIDNAKHGNGVHKEKSKFSYNIGWVFMGQFFGSKGLGRVLEAGTLTRKRSSIPAAMKHCQFIDDLPTKWVIFLC